MPYSAGRMLASKIAYSAPNSAGRIYPSLPATRLLFLGQRERKGEEGYKRKGEDLVAGDNLGDSSEVHARARARECRLPRGNAIFLKKKKLKKQHNAYLSCLACSTQLEIILV